MECLIPQKTRHIHVIPTLRKEKQTSEVQGHLRYIEHSRAVWNLLEPVQWLVLVVSLTGSVII